MSSEEIFILNNNIKSIKYFIINYESAKSEIYVDVQATLLTYGCYFEINQIYLHSMNDISRYICILILFLYLAVLSFLLVSSAVA